MKILLKAMLAIMAVFSMASCGRGHGFCTAEAVPGITLQVYDAVTGHPAACGAVAWLISGEYSERVERTLACSQPDSLNAPWMSGAHERAGVYSVVVLKEGYIPWLADDIFVIEGDCHVIEVNMDVYLQREE